MVKTDKELATDIVLKMLEMKILNFVNAANNTEDNNQKHLETICNAYKAVYQTVKQNN